MSDVSALERTGQFTIRSGKGGQEKVVERPHRHHKDEGLGIERGRKSGVEVAYRKGLQPRGPKTKADRVNLKRDLSFGFEDYKKSTEGSSGENRSHRRPGSLVYREETPGFSVTSEENPKISEAIPLPISEQRKTERSRKNRYFGRNR